MAKFIIPKIEKAHRDYMGDHQNNPVNIDLCTQIEKYDEPNGYGKMYPTIIFHGCDEVWYYGFDGQTIRNEQYNEIIAGNS